MGACGFEPRRIVDYGNEYMGATCTTAYRTRSLLDQHQRTEVLSQLRALPRQFTSEAGAFRVCRWIDPDGYAEAVIDTDKETRPAKLQWAPVDIAVQRRGNSWVAQMLSILPDVDAERFPGVYDSVSKVVAAITPALWRVMDDEDGKCTDPTRPHVLRVILKAVAQSLPEGHEYDGCWHREGAGEGIRAVGLYYLHGAAAELRLRPHYLTYHFSDRPFAQGEHVVKTTAGSAVAFSNRACVHRVRVQNCSTAGPMSSPHVALPPLRPPAAERAYMAVFVIGRHLASDTKPAQLPVRGLGGYSSMELAVSTLSQAVRSGLSLHLPEDVCERICQMLGCRDREGREETRRKLKGSRLHTVGTWVPSSGEAYRQNGWCAMDGGVMQFVGQMSKKDLVPTPELDWDGDKQA